MAGMDPIGFWTGVVLLAIVLLLIGLLGVCACVRSGQISREEEHKSLFHR